MNQKVLEKVLDGHENGYIILSHQLEILYVNKAVKELEPQSCCFLNTHLLLEEQQAAGFKCVSCDEKDCVLRKNLQFVMRNKTSKWIKNVPFKIENQIMRFNCLIEYVDDYICLEILNLKNRNPHLFLLDCLVNETRDFVFYKDAKFRYGYVNQAYADFLGREKEEILGKTDAELLPPEMSEICLKSDQLALEKGEFVSHEEVNGVIYKVNKGTIEGGIFGIAKDVTFEYNAGRLAYLDELTGLGNRRSFMEDIDHIYQLKQSHYYLALIDLDGLRDINNQYGHLKGDHYLKLLGSTLSQISECSFYRIGGDEFAALIPKSEQEIKQIFELIYNKLNQLSLTPKLSISVGVRNLDIEADYLKNYELTDYILYQAKFDGKNRVYFDN